MSGGPPARIVLTGPECTGKTTLAGEIASSLGAPLVVEAARRFAESFPGPLSELTVGSIARLSMDLEESAIAASPTAPAIIVRDTDLVSTVVYAKHYYGAVPPWIEEEARMRRADLYLLCAPDLLWVADGVRDRPAQREQMFGAFFATLASIEARVTVIRGNGRARLDTAFEAVSAWRATASGAATSPPPGRVEPRTP